jgi:hypothetical protein
MQIIRVALYNTSLFGILFLHKTLGNALRLLSLFLYQRDLHEGRLTAEWHK